MGALAAGGLSACRTYSGSAAYIGDTRITTTQVDSTIASLPKGSPVPAAEAQQLTLAYSALNAVAAKVGAQTGVATPKPDATEVSQIASQLKVPANNKFVQLIAQGDAWLNALLAKAPKVTPTDADLMLVYNTLIADGTVFQGGPTPSFTDIRPQLQQIPNLDQGLGLYQQMSAAAKSSDITINPRYAASCTQIPCPSLEIPVFTVQLASGQTVTALAVPLDDESHPVALDPTPTPSA
jgi:hypothetical protein